MASRQRQWTGYPGVYFVEKLQKKGGGKERVYYVVYRKGGRQVEEKVGHQYKDAMTPVRASRIRGERIEKDITYELPKKQGYTLNQLWALYREINGDKASSRGDIKAISLLFWARRRPMKWPLWILTGYEVSCLCVCVHKPSSMFLNRSNGS